MIDVATVVASVVGEVGLTELVKFFKGNKSQLQKAYEKAFQNTVNWYEKTYGNRYGKKNNRFFNYQPAEAEFAKLLLLRPDPDIGLISRIELADNKRAQPEVIQAFVKKLRQEMAGIRECEAVLVERKKFLSIKKIEKHVSTLPEFLPGMAKNIEKLTNKFVGEEKKLPSKIQPDPTPIDWKKLEKMFRDEYKLDRLDYGHLGTTRDRLEHKLELQKVYVALNVKDRSFDKIQTAAKGSKLTPLQYKNLPLLFQRFDDIVSVERDKGTNLIQTHEDIIGGTNFRIARKILQECDTNNLRQANVILKEIASIFRIERNHALRIITALCNWAIIPRLISEIPAAVPCHLFIGDAGGGKSTACRYLALKCFEALEDQKSKILEEEFGITGKTPLPIYLRLEDFEKMISDYQDGTCCLFECAAEFWQRADKTQLFTAGQLFHALQHQPVWLFLDGLDEISNPNYRMKLAKVVRDMVVFDHFPQLHITLTSRPAAITDELLNTLGIPYFTILNLEQDQIEDFAHRYFAANLLDEAESQVNLRAKELIDALEDVPAAKRLATNPLLLTVIAVLHYKEGKLPHYRAELYEKCIEQLMAQKAATPGKLETGKISFKFPPDSGKPVIEWNHNQITDMLRDLAFHAHQRTEDEVFLNPDLMLRRLRQSDLIPTEKKSSNELEEAARYFVDECDRLIGLLAFRGGNYVFIHRTFQEYLAAHWLSLQKEAVQQDHLLAMLKNASHWREVIRLFFNRLGKSNPTFGEDLMEQLGNLAAEQKDASLLQLAAECLSDFEEYQRRYRLHDRIKMKIENLRDTSHLQPQLFLACGDALGLMNEPAIDVFNPPMVFLNLEKPFKMGSEEVDNEKPIHTLQLSPYWIGKYPVTNKEFAEFIKHGGYENEIYWLDNENNFNFDGRNFLKYEITEKYPLYWLDERFGKSRPLAPIVGISWYEAMAYCRWWTLNFSELWSESHESQRIVMRLPTEAEWEFAARGLNERRFPWGDNPEPNLHILNFLYRRLEQTMTVGSYPIGSTPDITEEEKIFDLSGNVWEWCYDWYDHLYYKISPDNNPIGPQDGRSRVFRSGFGDEKNFRCAGRNSQQPSIRYYFLGFRAVWSTHY